MNLSFHSTSILTATKTSNSTAEAQRTQSITEFSQRPPRLCGENSKCVKTAPLRQVVVISSVFGQSLRATLVYTFSRRVNTCTLLLRHNVPPDRIERLAQALNRAWLWACAGQHADLACQAGLMRLDLDTWREIALAKSGEPCAWAAWAGALVAGAGEQTLTGYRKFGRHLGVLLQVTDDLHGVWHPKGVSDLTAGRLNLAVCYARSVVETARLKHRPGNGSLTWARRATYW